MSFDIKAKEWDDERRINRARIIADEISKAICSDGLDSALEFGCGTGLISFFLKDKVNQITLVDTSKGMIDVLNSKIEKFEIENMRAYQIDINEDNPLIEESYDIIYTSMAMHHVIDIDTTLKSFYRLLKKNGLLCIVDLDEEDGTFHSQEKDFKGHNGFNHDALKSQLEKVGFKDIDVNTFYKDERIIVEKSVEFSLFLMVGKKE